MEIDFVMTGKRIRELRINRQLSLNMLARRVGLSPAYLRHIETGCNKPSLQALYRIADALETSMDYLAGRTATVSDELTESYELSNSQQAAINDVLACIVPIITGQH